MAGEVLITGGTGRTGRFVVERLATYAQSMRLLVHKRTLSADLIPAGSALIRADLEVTDSLEGIAEGVVAIIAIHGSDGYLGKNGPERVDYGGVARLLWAIPEDEQPHFIYVSTLYVTRPHNPLNQYGYALDFKRRTEALLRTSGLPYTIVRPGWLADSPGGKGVRFEQGDTGEGSISREDLAEVLVKVLYNDDARGKTFEVFEEQSFSPNNWPKLFGALEPDPFSKYK